jgi:hypothetical protein
VNPGVRAIIRLLAERAVQQCYAGAAADETSGFSTENEARERVLTEAGP